MTKYSEFILFLTLLIYIPNTAKAECNNESETQIETYKCAKYFYENEDKRLNEIYQTKMASLDNTAQNKLRLQERRWIKKNNADCKAEANAEAEGGSM